MLLRCALPLLILLGSDRPASGQEWTRFRGPNGSGIATGKTIPTVWKDSDINWKLALPGPGHSSPAIWGQRVFVTSGDDATNRLWLLAAETGDGRVAWKKSFELAPYRKNALNSTASSSPAVDERHVYLSWTVPDHLWVMAFSHDGKRAWERDLGPYAAQHGGGPSPMVYGNKVFLANEQDGESFLVGLDAARGEIAWKTPRKTVEAAYATPCVYQPQSGPAQLVFASHAHGFTGIAPDTGKVLWEAPDVFDKRVVSSPFPAAGLLIASCGSGGGGNYLAAVRPGRAEGEKPEVAFTIRKSAPYVPTSIAVGDLLFLWSEDGVVTCLQAGSGEVRWQERVGKHYYSSPVCVDGRLFCVSTTGEIVVIKAADKFELLARNPLGETTHSTPAVAGGRMYIHTIKHLINIGGRQAAAP